MIVLDTNVVSELMRPAPAAKVLGWINGQPASQLFITTITRAEILTGVMLLPRGKRRDAIASAAGEMFDRDFAGRILAFESNAAEAYATIASARRRAGRPITAFDAQIAAIARSHDAALATRNVSDVAGCGVEIIDPWSV